jgi:hypothetical protein
LAGALSVEGQSAEKNTYGYSLEGEACWLHWRTQS